MINFDDDFKERTIVLEGTVTDKWFELVEDVRNKQLEQKELMYYGTFVNSDGVEDSLILGIDISKKDKSTIVVGRNINGRYEIINQIWDEEAEKLYYRLIGKDK
jgi:hypothetical protein